MFRSAAGQLVLVALTACVGAESSGFLKSTGSAVLKTDAVLKMEEAVDAVLKMDAANVRENAVIKRTWAAMIVRHKTAQGALRAAMHRYKIVVMKRYACTSASTRAALLKQIVLRNKKAVQDMHITQSLEQKLFTRRSTCMQQVPGDQSLATNAKVGSSHLIGTGMQVTTCMKASAMLEKSPVIPRQGLTQEENAALKKRMQKQEQEMTEHAMNDSFEDLFNTEQKYDINKWTLPWYQMDAKWEKDHKKELQQCEQLERSAKAERSTLVSEFEDALAHAKKAMAEARKGAVAKKDDA